ncbi:MAG: 50S ribosomal protein L30 [Lysobacterales bacterium]|nr:MAG: 50S ribosomal protein L30 [Xanthomonadales bacterium]
MAKVLRITLVRSPIGYSVRQRRTLLALGLRKLNQTVDRADTVSVRGMVQSVTHLVEVDEVEA